MRQREATIEDLYRVKEDGKAELVGGRVVLMGGTGWLPGFSANEISVSLRDYGRRTKRGYAASENVSFVVDLPNRRSFCPDVAFTAEPPRTGEFINGAPVFAAGVRSKGDYGRAAERAMAVKRAEYFTAGTLVVWDVDVLRNKSSASIARATPRRRRAIVAVNTPKPNRRSRVGRCPWTISFPRNERLATTVRLKPDPTYDIDCRLPTDYLHTHPPMSVRVSWQGATLCGASRE